MNREEYEFVLMDRIAKIQAINNQYDLENNAHISFSGGKDSIVLSTLFDLALPNNKIPRVYFNTGIEYHSVRKFVKNLSLKDTRIQIINSGVNIKKMLEIDGYPFKSKGHSHNWLIYKNNEKTVNTYFEMINNNKSLLQDANFVSLLPKGIKTSVKYVYGIWEKDGEILNSIKKCPEILKYQFERGLNFKISDKCCYRLKKEIALKYEKDSKRYIAITGIRGQEGGMRGVVNCTIFKDNKLLHFHPLQVINEEWEEEFIKRNNIVLCELYYPPYNFKRTGCKGCPFALDLKEQLATMEKFLPAERKQCEYLWKPVYEEYRRIGYRLDKEGGKDNGKI